MEDYHVPALLHESTQGLNIKPDGIYIDVTFGGGGHSKVILDKLEKNGRLIAFDQDSDAIKNVPKDKRITFVNHNFKYMQHFLNYLQIDKVDGILADLGISSHQINDPQRGFSFKDGEKLDMRMNNQAGITAEEIVNQYPTERLVHIFRLFGEIPQAKALVNKLADYRQIQPIKTQQQFLEAIKPVLPLHHEFKFLAKVYQALRIEVNRELEVLTEWLKQTEKWIRPGGRLAVISYHSLEDRLVKNYIKSGNLDGAIEKDLYGNFYRPFCEVNRKVIVPTEEELKTNNRARSAKLRIAEKNDLEQG
ncbi:MAG: 16S rRNA (cytosine(1402)-N(4))-methyltransferase RsmH [Bacteroidales bacterium]|nr:16S rRNA (cytosine(1402)-N(4))-methyltransferase RsmH [Bacteroidales bacterium]